MWRKTWQVLLTTLIMIAPAARAADYLDVETKVGDDRLQVLLDGRAIVSTSAPLFSETGCTLEYRIAVVPGGFDVFATVANDTDEPQERPRFTLTGVNIGPTLNYLDSRTLGHAHRRGLEGFNWNMQYPEDMYAPVLAAWNEVFAVGVALIYDPKGEKHAIRGLYHDDTLVPPYRGSLNLGFSLHAPRGGNNPFADPGHELQPPGTRSSYRFAVRFARPEPERRPHPGWLDALAPYREFFVETYGAVRYERDLRPVMGQPVAQSQFLHEENNPRGFHRGFGGDRLDLLGWGPYAAWLREQAALGYRRVMVWVPSGLYLVGSNYPPEFMTELPAKLVETMPELMALKQEGITVGIWWGRSNQVSGGWNSGKMWNRNIENPEDRQAAFAELDRAVAFGVEEVGLDAWARLGLWQRYDWMRTLRERYPGLNLITESSDCDIMHTLAPTFTTFSRQPQRPVLADWLVPGHESWIQLRVPQATRENFDLLTSWQCVPVTMSRGLEHDASAFPAPRRPAE